MTPCSSGGIREASRWKLEKSRLPLADARTKNAISNRPVPACDMIRKSTPALRVSFFSCSKLIRQYDISAITSHATRKKNAFDAEKTSARLSSSRLKKNPKAPRFLRPSIERRYPKE